MVDSWRDFLRPVPDDAVPGVREHILHATRVGAAVAVFCTALIFVADVLAGQVHPGRQLVISLSAIVTVLLIRAATNTQAGARRPELLLLATAFTIIVASLCQSWATYTDGNPLHDLVFVIVVAVGAYTPWQMRYSVVLGAGTGVAYLLLAIPFPQPDGVSPVLVVGLTVTFTAVAIGSSQFQRRLWARLHRANVQANAVSRLSGIGRISEGLAHEARTPLASTQNEIASARLLLDELRRSVGHPEVTPADLDTIFSEIEACLDDGALGLERVATLVGSLRGHAYELRDRPARSFALEQSLRDVAGRFADHTHPVVRVEPVPTDILLWGDAYTLRRVLHALVKNAVEAIAESSKGSQVRLGATAIDDAVVVWVADDGPGVSSQVAQRLFEPMVTTRSQNAALGLGLPIARDLVESVFEGQLVHVQTTSGARFEVRLPRRRRAHAVRLDDEHTPVFALEHDPATDSTP